MVKRSNPGVFCSRIRRVSFSLPAVVLASLLLAHGDGVRPLRFGPYLQQDVLLEGSPFGSRYMPPSGAYNLQVGWMEPINILPHPLFRGTYLETQGNATVSPYQSDVGVIFNLKPIRFLEGGLGYNRLLFPYTLVGFNTGGNKDSLPSPERWRTTEILDLRKREAVGADVFTFQANFTMDVGPVQLHAGAFRSLWDVDVTDRDVVLEYHSGLLIQKRERINSFYGQTLIKMNPDFMLAGITARGIEFREQYWWATHTGLDEHLLSVGLSGIRRGRNNDRLYHGLDGLVGYWVAHPQLRGGDVLKRFHLSLQWMWNIQILHLGEN